MTDDYELQIINTNELIYHFTEVRNQAASDLERMHRLLEILINRKHELERLAADKRRGTEQHE